MTTPQEPQDPFTAPSAPLPPQAQQPPAAYPPPTHIVVGQSSAPTALALWATVLTGAVAAMALVGALTSESQLEETKAALANPEGTSLFTGQSPIDYLSTPLMIASFVVLALWMSRVRSAMVARRETPGGPPAVEWWGWFVPLGNFVLPFLGMRAVTRRKANTGVVIAWWIAFCAYWVASFASVVPTFSAVDFTTGELTNPEALDVLVPLSWAGAIALIVSWVFLTLTIRQATAAEKAISAQGQGMPA